jgi:hypothetical protein
LRPGAEDWNPLLRAFFMKSDRFFLSYLFFLLLFFYSAALRFESEIAPLDLPGTSFPSPFLFLTLAALALMICLRAVFRISMVYLGGISFLVTIGLFIGGLNFEEKVLRSQWRVNSSEQVFAKVSGHCSPKVGRAMLRFFNRSFRSKKDADQRELKIDSECRLRHFRFVSDQASGPCLARESASKCALRWAGVFGQARVWDHSTREYFFQWMLDSWQKDHDPESMVSFVLRDQELVNLAPEAGQEKKHDEVSGKIFRQISDLIQEKAEKGKPQPYHFKFRESYADFLSRTRSNGNP